MAPSNIESLVSFDEFGQWGIQMTETLVKLAHRPEDRSPPEIHGRAREVLAELPPPPAAISRPRVRWRRSRSRGVEWPGWYPTAS